MFLLQLHLKDSDLAQILKIILYIDSKLLYYNPETQWFSLQDIREKIHKKLSDNPLKINVFIHWKLYNFG